MLKDKVILVTGSTGGIGLEIAKACVEAGAKVMLHGRRKEEAEYQSQQLGDNASFILGDLEDPETPKKIIDTVLQQFGRLDGLVNNAGLSPRSTIDDVTAERIDFTYAINLRAPMLLCRYATEAFRKNGGGTIVNIGSINAWCGANNLLIYSTTKGAMMTMTRNLGHALGREKIRVNQLNVGWTWTENEHKLQLDEGGMENWREHVSPAYAPSGSILLPENVAPHVVFWLSEKSAPVTGQVYEVEQYPLLGRNMISEF